MYTTYIYNLWGIILNLQNILDKFDEKFTTIEVIESSDGNVFTFNKFDVVPVRCDISHFLSEGMEVEETFYTDKVTVSSDDELITFDLANNTQEMIYSYDITSLDVTKISETEYLQAIQDDEDFFNLLK